MKNNERGFDNIIGYETVKQELRDVCDALVNRETYRAFGVDAPRGLLLYGDPGLGKTLMAKSLIEAAGLPTFTCRKDVPNGEFVHAIKAAFDEAAKAAPSIVYLDDMDKFADGDEDHRNQEEYVTVQSCIDEAPRDVFVLATVNDMDLLPPSLRRAGRFDRVIEIDRPEPDDAAAIIRHYLKNKPHAEALNADEIARVMRRASCAELEATLNAAGMIACRERAEALTMRHFLAAFLNLEHDIPPRELTHDWRGMYPKKRFHEAGHAVVSEVLFPGSVTMIVATDACSFVSCDRTPGSPQARWLESRIMTSLGGKTASELVTGEPDPGSFKDLRQAYGMAEDLFNNGMTGMLFYEQRFNTPEILDQQKAYSLQLLIERFRQKTQEVLVKNRGFLDEIARELETRAVLTAADIAAIRAKHTIVEVAA